MSLGILCHNLDQDICIDELAKMTSNRKRDDTGNLIKKQVVNQMAPYFLQLNFRIMIIQQ